MKSNKIDEKLAVLRTINRVDAPPFLFTKIMARTKDAAKNYLSFRQAFGWSVAFLLVLTLNIALLLTATNNSSAKNQAEINLAESMNLSPNNMMSYE